MLGFGFMPPPPRSPQRRKPKPGETRRQAMSASLAGAKDMGAVLIAVVVLTVILAIVVALSSLRG